MPPDSRKRDSRRDAVAGGPDDVPAPAEHAATARGDWSAVEDLQETFKRKLYEAMMEPSTLRALRELLTTRDTRIRTKAWEMILAHAWPVSEDGDGGPATIVVNMNVPRPPGGTGRTVEVEPGPEEQ